MAFKIRRDADVSTVKRLKELEIENPRLKKDVCR